MIDVTVSKEDKLRALNRILASKEFNSSPRRRAFLRYIVEAEAAGKGHLIKEYSIAVDAYREDPSFDSSSRSNIRVQARRVREALDRYYADAGAADPLRIVIPVGSYTPIFVDQDPASAALASEGAEIKSEKEPEPAPVASPPEEPAGQESWRRFHKLWAVVGLALAACLAALAVTFGAVDFPRAPSRGNVMPRVTLESASLATLKKADSAYFAFASNLRTFLGLYDTVQVTEEAKPDDPLAYRVVLTPLEYTGTRVLLSLSVLGSDGRVIVTERENFSEDGDDGPIEAAGKAAALIADRYGIVNQDLMTRKIPDSLRCLLQSHDFIRQPRQDDYPRLKRCLIDATHEPSIASYAYNDLAQLTLLSFYSGEETDSDGPLLRQAKDYTQAALDLSSQSISSYVNLFTILRLEGRDSEAEEAARKVLRINANSPEVLARIGIRRVAAGATVEGMGLLKRAVVLAPRPPSVVAVFLFVGAFSLGNTDAAASYSDSPRIEFHPIGLLAKIIVSHTRGDQESVAKYDRLLIERFPTFARDVPGALKRNGIEPAIVTKLLDAVRAAGASCVGSVASRRP